MMRNALIFVAGVCTSIMLALVLTEELYQILFGMSFIGGMLGH